MLDVIAAEHPRPPSAKLGTDLSRFTSEQMLELAQYNLFPNATVLVWGEMLNVLLGAPGPTPDQSELVMLHASTERPPPTRRARRPVDVTMPADDAVGTGVIAQDIAVLQTAQRGPAPARPHAPDAVERGVPHPQHAPQPRASPRHRAEPARATGLKLDELLAREEIHDVIKRLAAAPIASTPS